MRYNQEDIGKRIASERSALGISQTEFLRQLNYAENHARQYVGKWENGKVLPPLDVMLKMCKLFNCELGYLLCQHDCKNKVATDIQKEIGLSERAIDKLRKINNFDSFLTEILSKMIEHEDFYKLLFSISNHVMTYNEKIKRIDEKYREAIAQYMNCKSDEIVREYMEVSSKMLITSLITQIISDIGNKKKKKTRAKAKPLFRLS